MRKGESRTYYQSTDETVFGQNLKGIKTIYSSVSLCWEKKFCPGKYTINVLISTVKCMKEVL